MDWERCCREMDTYTKQKASSRIIWSRILEKLKSIVFLYPWRGVLNEEWCTCGSHCRGTGKIQDFITQVCSWYIKVSASTIGLCCSFSTSSSKEFVLFIEAFPVLIFALLTLSGVIISRFPVYQEYIFQALLGPLLHDFRFRFGQKFFDRLDNFFHGA